MQAYSDPERAEDPHALPDIEVFELTAEEAAALDEEATFEACKRFPLASMNSRERAKAIAWIIAEYGDLPGFYWQACFPGCLPDGEPMGPFATKAEALADAQS